MFEINVLYCAPAGCTGSQNRAPGSLSMGSSLYKGIDRLEKNMHTPGAQVQKSVCPTAKMCTQGAGCTLNFEHCIWTKQRELFLVNEIQCTVKPLIQAAAKFRGYDKNPAQKKLKVVGAA